MSECSAGIQDERNILQAVLIDARMIALKPPLAELFAILEGLRLAPRPNFSKIQVESDYLEAMKLINKLTTSFNENRRCWLSEIWEILKDFDVANVIHVNKKCNWLANTLAKRARTSTCSYVISLRGC